MATQWEISDAKTRLEEMLNRARGDEEIVLSENGRPVVRVLPAKQANGTRIFGEFAGKIHMTDDFAAPLDLK
jgi:prevent-host-death family protein